MIKSVNIVVCLAWKTTVMPVSGYKDKHMKNALYEMHQSWDSFLNAYRGRKFRMWQHLGMGSSIWRPHIPYERSRQNSTVYGKKLRKILESKPKSTVALKIVINPAGMALDIKIFHGIQLELNTGQAIFSFAGFHCLFNWNCYTVTFFHRGCGFQME